MANWVSKWVTLDELAKSAGVQVEDLKVKTFPSGVMFLGTDAKPALANIAGDLKGKNGKETAKKLLKATVLTVGYPAEGSVDDNGRDALPCVMVGAESQIESEDVW